jgi:hypothetical protein
MRNHIIISLSALLLAACSHMPAPELPAALFLWQEPTQTPATTLAPPVQAVKAPPPTAAPQVGSKQVQNGPSVWKEYRCGTKTLPFIVLERNEIPLSIVQPGEEFRQSFLYALCSAEPSKSVEVTLSRTIVSKGKTVIRDTVKHFELKPGRWAVNALVNVPPQAKPGAYELQLSLTSQTITIKGVVPFFVVQKQSR